ncbi:response regulator [sulfur-oxidizing endosymbiont of Gigantopelta aegis]|uniref:response regulator n=1 Tax=sulfur-oxidizing endosymbiont of Gigantopelta aegis TaxID=2794934 RepID=UPI0018DB07B9|nr:response regulator [sulfur-oxidizing endosymbiont of Gigantopelta aegis]
MQILLVEDDLSLADGLQQALGHEGITVNHVANGKEALHVVESFPPDIVLLDLGLPDMDGLDVIKAIRRKKLTTPVLILTARNTVQDTVSGLDCGADDYLAKPFEISELLARIRVLERRISTTAESNEINIGQVSLDTESMQVKVSDKLLVLSKSEYMLLKALMQNAGRVQTRDGLESQLYSWGEEVSSNALEVHIHHLRKKIGIEFIKTVRGVGYTINKV